MPLPNIGLTICGIGRAIGIGRRGITTAQLPLQLAAITRSSAVIKSHLVGNLHF